jgi:predicted nucleotidyltransferase component of viral defense system
MVTFGELRKKSAAWQTELGTVEKIYARDWLLKGVFDNATLREKLALRGASALASAYFAEYPRVEDVDFARDAALDDAALARELDAAVKAAARASGLQFHLHSFQSSHARVEFTGPLGRRSAAQPLIVTRFLFFAPRTPTVERALVHPFGDACESNVRAVAFQELAAERMVGYVQKPRARDVFDLWFVLTQGEKVLNAPEAFALAQSIARAKNIPLRAQLDRSYAPLLERAWENALRSIPHHPPFAQAREEIEAKLAPFIA